ncbi:alpha/beta hydrolase [Nocardioides sp. cx-173]|uniref:alpha/beta hydrolase n=1 Tax=Nocardioides sp. cx-173 TaxID=2898796 RepID=UPI001E300056|nr:alpha/beta hydrolase [Nocardioides sp. cx-173]MCD4527135.1 alpha/beta hydrolase [Nocardioides sp. cx-173]UGB42498.1 alpha/beta hydrolase [Nocardioides sp. cx-173]
MEAQPRLIPVRQPEHATGIALVLHGGASRGQRMMVSPTQLSVVRMAPTAKRVAREGRGKLAVYRLLNSYRGWDTQHTPVRDVEWALDELRGRHGVLPVGLVGHSLGGRAALLAGDRPGVESVVALNPWVYPDDTVDLSGRRVLFVHGLADRVALPQRAEAVARRVAQTTDVGFISIPGGKHAMLRHGRSFDGYGAEFTAVSLLGHIPRGSVSSAVMRVLDGDAWVTA